MKKYNVAVVGATGLVGRTFLKVLAEYDFPINNLVLYASARSAGKKVLFKDKEYTIVELTHDAFDDIDIALFSAGGGVSKEYAPIAAKKGAVVIDNSSAWRMDNDCALIVPEINIDDAYSKSNIIANPNCSTIQSVLPLKPLLDTFGLKRVVYTTYQSVSGSGQKGVNDLNRCKNGEKPEFYPYDIANTCIPEIDEFLDDGYTKEEMKMVNETRKILHVDNLLISATCIRVPVEACHGVMIQVELEKEFTIEGVKEALSSYPGIILYDDVKNHIYPNSIVAKDKDEVYVGRIRRDLSCENGLLLYCVADNIRKGAAANAVQIAMALDIDKCKK
ncbi:MAG: aspartate-semialdehyde dehydrogenase [Erysipelotrichaceae bacterium]|nr:aspartate-semialdehyde dehydrogenase [Erysipelotrichaceae bacterium]